MYGVEYRYSPNLESSGAQFGATFPQSVSVIAFVVCFSVDAWIRDQLLAQIRSLSPPTKTALASGATSPGAVKLEARPMYAAPSSNVAAHIPEI